MEKSQRKNYIQMDINKKEILETDQRINNAMKKKKKKLDLDNIT